MNHCYLITHGDRKFGPDPGMTAEGFKQIRQIAVPTDVSLVVIGTGRRFREIYEAIKPMIPEGTPVKFSPFCGGADGLDNDGKVVLVDGTKVDLKTAFLGVSNTKAFHAWEFVAALPTGTLFCSGRPLMIALGFKDLAKMGKIYQLYPEAKKAVEL